MNLRNKLKIRSEIVNDLKSGARKIDIYNSLIQKHGNEPIFERILNIVPSPSTVKKYNASIKCLLTILVVIAVIKVYFLVVSFVKPSGSPNFLMFSAVALQLLVIWMIYKFSRTGLIATAVYSILQLFDYQKGIYLENVTIKYLCIILLISFTLSAALSMFLYFKSKENWKHT